MADQREGQGADLRVGPERRSGSGLPWTTSEDDDAEVRQGAEPPSSGARRKGRSERADRSGPTL